MTNDPKTGFKMVGAVPPPEEIGSSLGLFLPRDSLAALNKLTIKEHKFLQALLERLSADLQALQGAKTPEDIAKMMATVGKELTAAVKLKTLNRLEAQELVINMVSAVAASGVRCLFLSLLHQANKPEETK